jgi:3-oxoacid CoA-transferase A subunit
MAEAVADIPDGARVVIGGFTAPGTPRNLIKALRDQGAKDLTLILNSPGRSAGYSGGALVESGQVRRIVSAFSALSRDTSIPFEKLVESGELETELMPQGTLVERLRAGGAGIGAFYTPTGVGTELAEGRETRVFDGREYLLELPLRADYAFLRAHRADTLGNLSFRLAQRNFGPIMALAADITIVEVEQPIAEPGELDPDLIHVPRIAVSRIVQIPPPPEGLWDEGS